MRGAGPRRAPAHRVPRSAPAGGWVRGPPSPSYAASAVRATCTVRSGLCGRPAAAAPLNYTQLGRPHATCAYGKREGHAAGAGAVVTAPNVCVRAAGPDTMRARGASSARTATVTGRRWGRRWGCMLACTGGRSVKAVAVDGWRSHCATPGCASASATAVVPHLRTRVRGVRRSARSFEYALPAVLRRTRARCCSAQAPTLAACVPRSPRSQPRAVPQWWRTSQSEACSGAVRVATGQAPRSVASTRGAPTLGFQCISGLHCRCPLFACGSASGRSFAAFRGIAARFSFCRRSL